MKAKNIIPQSYSDAIASGKVERAILGDTNEARKQTAKQCCLIKALYAAGLSPTGWTLSEVEGMGIVIPCTPWDKLKEPEKRSLLAALKKLPAAVIETDVEKPKITVSRNARYHYPGKIR